MIQQKNILRLKLYVFLAINTFLIRIQKFPIYLIIFLFFSAN